jgi:hypothetical protein
MPQDGTPDRGPRGKSLGRRPNKTREAPPVRRLVGTANCVKPHPTLSATHQVHAYSIELVGTAPSARQPPQISEPKMLRLKTRLDLLGQRLEEPVLKAFRHAPHLLGP